MLYVLYAIQEHHLQVMARLSADTTIKIENILNLIKYNQALYEHSNSVVIQKLAIIDADAHRNIYSTFKQNMSTGLYNGDDLFLNVLTSKPVVILVGICAATLLIYFGYNSLSHNETINKNLVNLSGDLNTKISKVNTNLDEHTANLHTSLTNLNNNVTVVNENLSIIGENLVTTSAIIINESSSNVISAINTSLANSLKAETDNIVHQILNYFERKFFKGGGGNMEIPTLP